MSESYLASAEDWRILRLLSIYRVILVALLVTLYEAGVAPLIVDDSLKFEFRLAANGYGLVSFVLLTLVFRHWLGARFQAVMHFAIDVVAISTVMHASGGVASGLGVLIITPAVACAMVVRTRMALSMAAFAFFALLVEELYRQTGTDARGVDFAAAGMLGLMFFGACVASNAVAQRARHSEAIAERVGSAFENLSALNETVLRSMQTGVVVVDDELFIKTTNTAAQRLLGARYGLRGRRIHLEAPALGRRLQQWLIDGQGSSDPVPPNPGGVEIVPRFSRLTGGAAAVLVLIDDAASLREQAQQMKLAALGRLSAGIAHEIRNPLSAIMHASQLLNESEAIPWEDRRLLDMIERHGQRIDRIIRDVLALSRRDTSNPTSINIASWLERSLLMYREGLAGQSREIHIASVEPDLIVRFDPDHLQQVVFNLMNNAFEHAGAKPEDVVVTLSAGRTEAGRPCLELHDNGPGIPPENLDHMFEPFFTTSHKGTGLGLYLARELCEYNQARISYLPQGPGAGFRIVFAAEA